MNDQELLKDWLDECRTESTRLAYQHNIGIFLEWYGKGLSEFLGLDGKGMRHVALTFQNACVNGWMPKARINDRTKKGEPLKANSIIGVLTALGSFTRQNDKMLILKGKRIHQMIDLDSHVFTNGDLTKIWTIAGVEGKALLSTMTSLGWEISSILELKRNFIESLVFKAQEDRRKFVYFIHQRRKTGAVRLGVLNPLALEWLHEWVKVSPAEIEQVKNVYEHQKSVWNRDMLFSYMTREGVNGLLKDLCREAHVTVTGRVHTHGLRKWVMSGLSRAGFNEFQIKFVMGKKIPLSDLTYLQTLQQEVEARYPQAYEQYLDISGRKVMQMNDEDRRILELLRRPGVLEALEELAKR